MNFEDNSSFENEQDEVLGSSSGADTVVNPGQGNTITLPAGATLEDLEVDGRDLVVNLADGSRIVIPDGAIFVPQIVIDGVAVPPFNVAQLLTGNEPEPAAGPAPSSGGNFADDEGEIQAAFDIGDLLPFTDFSFPEETEEEIFPTLGDEEPTVEIQTADSPVALQNAVADVDEGGLPARGTEPAGTDEPSDSETTTGTIIFDSPDGPSSILINGVEITAPGQTITTPLGTLTITDVDLSTGTIGYSYTLDDNTTDPADADEFAVTVIDADGDEGNATLTINIVDDAPIAADDVNEVGAGSFEPVSGDVLVNDVPGADGYATSGAVSGFSNANGSAEPGDTLQGAYGTLTLNDDGSYTYTRDPNTPGGVEDSFEYTIVDQDGSTSTATLTISIADSPPQIIFVPDAENGAIVDEAGLDDRGTESPGSGEIADGDPDNDSDPSEATSSTITFNSPDGVDTVTIGGVVIDPNGLPQTVIDDDTGTLVIVDFTFDPVTGDGEITFDFTLGDNTDGDDTSVSFDIEVTDLDGDVASDTLTIEVVDDVPIAVDDFAVQESENAPVTVDVFGNDTAGADGVAFDAIALVDGTLSGAGQLVNNGDGTFTYTPGPGEEGTVTFDYEITDGDGDVSTATVTIDLLEDSEPEIGVEGENIVAEAGLGARPGEPEGSDAASDSEFTSGVIAVSTGNDTVGSLVINGVDVTNGGTVTTANGVLTVALENGDYTYTYELSDNTLADPDSDSFSLEVTDSDGDTASTTLVIAILDDVPAAEDDANSIAAGEFGPATGNVLDNDTQGADGAAVTAFTGTGGSGVAGDVVQGEFGTLTLNDDGSYSYTRDPGTPGGVSDTFNYTITDGDGDTAQANLVIAIGDAPVTLDLPVAGDAGTQVDEAGLAGPPAGSDAASDSEQTTGTFTFTAPDGPATISIGGVDVTSVGQTFTGAFGTLTIDAIADGSITYTYELTTNTDGDATSDDFAVAVTDQDGDAVSDTLEIAIVDDVPTANADVDSVTEDGPTVASGNVLTAIDVALPDANTTDGVADVTGADGAVVSGVAAGDTGSDVAGNVDANVVGAYGAITIGADGSYIYALDNANPAVQGLDGTETLTEVFTYTITDGDGDTSTTTVTITVNGTDDPVVINGLDGEGAEEVLDEDDLADGSSPDAGSLVQTGSFTIDSQDGLSTLTIGGVSVFDASSTTTFPVTIDDPVYGLLEITGIATTTDANGDVVSATVSYSYTLDDNSLLHTGGNDGSFTDSFDVVATDTDGSSDTASLDITVIDDTPTANDDTAGQVNENEAIVIDALANDTFGADGVDTTDAASVVVSTQASQGTVTYDPSTGQFTYTPAPGAGSNGNVTDFFEYTITDGDGDTSTARVDVTLQPDSEPIGDETSAAVDDDGLAGGNAASSTGDLDANVGDVPTDTSEATFSGEIPFGVGNDGPAVIAFAAAVNGTTAAIGQETVTYNVNGNILTATVTGGDRDGTDLFTVEITDTATGTYVVTLLDNVVHTAGGDENDAFASIDFSVTDSEGETAPASLSITFDDDTPTATANSNTVGEGASVSGNVLTDDDGAGVDVAGADGLASPGAISAIASTNDGTSQTIVDGSGNLVISTSLGTLTINATTGAYTYQSDAESTNVDAQDVFTYTIVDGDGDPATATLTIDVNNVAGVVSDNDVVVNEAGLPIGSDAASDSEIDADGQIDVTGATGTLVYNLLSPADGTFGTLVLNSATGEYTYTLDTPFTDTVDENGANTVTDAESFNFEVRDTLGNLIGTGTIDVDIIDDIPTATDQVSISVAEDAVGTIGGNVVTDGTPDTEGADGATVTAITIDGTTTAVAQDGSDTIVVTANGTYTINQNGDWTFDPNPNLDQSAGDIDASFTYTLTDGDGDFDTAAQPILIQDGAGPVAGPDISLGLDDANLADGSTPANPDSTNDTIVFTAGSDDIASIVFGDVSALDGGLTWTRVSDTQITGSDGGRLVVTLDLSVTGTTATVTATLNDNFDDHPIANVDDLVDLGDVSVVATDTDGDTASATVSVSVSDDLPSISASAPAADALTVDETDFAIDATADFSSLFTSDANADGPGSPVTYALGVNAGATGLVDTESNQAVVLTENNGVIEGRTAGSDELVFTVSVDAAGVVTLDQQRAVVHADANDANDPASLAAANLITLTGTIVDSDGDSASATADIAGAITFLDDGPALSGVSLGSAVDVDETDGLPQSDSSAASIIDFTSDFGADGDGGTAFGLSVVNSASGLATAAGDYPITLVQTSPTTITGTFDPGTGPQSAFTATINADGTVTLTQIVALEHTVDGDDTAGEHNDTLNLDGLINATVTITDGDGDTASETIGIGGALTFFDDGPSVSLSGNDVDLNVSDGTLGTDDSQNFASAFTFDGGEDGLAGTSYALAVSSAGADSGLVDLASGEAVLLTLNGGVVEGRTATGGDLVFTVSVDASGNVTLDQLRVIDHDLSNGDGATASLLSDGLVQLIGTGTDNDGDTASATLDIGSDLLFADTVPVAAPDTDTVAEGGAIIAGAVDGVLPNDTTGADTPIEVVGAAAGDQTGGGGTVSGNVGAAIAGTFGTLTLNGDGSYTYVSNPNSVTPAGAQDVFTYTITDQDGDLSTTTLTINITDVSLVGDDENAVVNEAALDTAQDGDDLAAGSVEGTNPTSTDETVTGQVTVAGTGVTYAINGSTTGSNGVIAINAATGEFTYTLTDPVTSSPAADDGTNTELAVESFTYTATDANGNTTTGTITIDVIDDAPVATDDGEIASVDDNASAVTVGTVAGLTGNDDFGADGEGTPAITIATGSLGGTVSIVGGDLVYTSATNITAPFTDQVETFTYTITDGDGDTDTATFEIRLTDEGPAIASVAAAFTVDEDGLAGGIAGGSGDVAGEVTVQMGTLSGLDFGVDGAGDIALTAVADTGLTTLAGNAVETVYDPGSRTLTGQDAVTGDDVFTLVITDVGTGAYTFTLLAPLDHPTTGTEDDLALNVGVVVTDAEGDTANGTISVTIDDDTPEITSPISDEQVLNDPNAAVLTGDLNFDPGADGAGDDAVITADVSDLTVSGQPLITSQTGNVLTAFVDSDGSGTLNAGDLEVFTLTVDPDAGTSGEYEFDLLVPVDGETTVIDIGTDGAFGVGPTESVIVSQGSTGDELVFVTGWEPVGNGGAFTASELAAWLGGSIPDLSQRDDVNGSTAGFGLGNNNFDAGEFMRFDFGALDDYDGPGSFVPPAGTDLLNASFVTFSLENFGNGDEIHFVANFTDGTSQTFTFTGSGGNSTETVTISAPPGALISFVDAYAESGSVKLNLDEVGATETTVDVDIPVTIELVDGDGDPVSDNFVINLFDDAPDAQDDIAATVIVEEDINAAFVLDFSGSVNDSELNLQLNAVKDAAFELFESTSGDVDITLITFSATSQLEGTFSDFATFAAEIDSLNDELGGDRTFDGATDFTDAIQEVLAEFTPDATANNQIFFLSDGNPNQQTGPGGTSLTTATANAFQTFVDDNDINVTTIGVGGGVDIARLQDVDVDGEGAPILAADFEDLIDTLISVVSPPIGGNVLDNDVAATNGIEVVSISVNGVNYAFDGVNTITPSVGSAITGTSFTATTTFGGELTFDFSDGSFTYVPPTVTVPEIEAFQYVVVDGDGDTDTAVLQIDIAAVSADPNFASNDVIITNVGSTLSFDESLLLANDDAGTTLTSVGGASGGTVSNSGTTITFNDTGDESGSFTYEGANGGNTDNAFVTVNREQAGETNLDGTSANDILIGRDVADNIDGEAGDDILVGNGGNDELDGGAGADLLTGGAGNDTFLITDGDASVVLGGSGDNGTVTGFDTITDFNVVGDILDFTDGGDRNVPSDTSGVNGVNSTLTIGGQTINSHAINDGIITFSASNTFSSALTLTSESDVAAVVDYIQSQGATTDLGENGLVAFTVGSDTFLYYQDLPGGPSASNDSLIKLEGVTITDLDSLVGATAATGTIRPVVLDLDGDGVEFVGLDAGVTIDLDGDGTREATAFAGADDAILAFDANGDGTVTDASEFVFGDDVTTDLEAVAARFDDNGDGVLDASDSAFAQFGIWQDANLNGIADEGEFTSLEDAGITSIGLISDGVQTNAADGDVEVFGTSVFTKADGTTGAVADASFVTQRQSRTQEQALAAAAGFAAISSTEVAAQRASADEFELDIQPANTGSSDDVEASIAGVDGDTGSVGDLLGTSEVAGEQVSANLLSGDEGAVEAAGLAEVDSAQPSDADPISSDDGASDTPIAASAGFGGDGVDQTMQALLSLEAAPVAEIEGEQTIAGETVEAVLADIQAENLLDQIIDDLSDQGEAPEQQSSEPVVFDSFMLDNSLALSFNPAEPIQLMDGQLDQAAAATVSA
ncbi:MAG: DUF5801 repeats-in-toxin domain-containing protein [Erythrobacter sp.]